MAASCRGNTTQLAGKSLLLLLLLLQQSQSALGLKTIPSRHQAEVGSA